MTLRTRQDKQGKKTNRTKTRINNPIVTVYNEIEQNNVDKAKQYKAE